MISRYDNLKTKESLDGKQVLTSLTLPVIADREDDVYIITNTTDRLDSLAYKYYGEAKYWWIIAVTNNVGKGTLALEPGTQLRIPRNPSSVIDQLRSINNI